MIQHVALHSIHPHIASYIIGNLLYKGDTEKKSANNNEGADHVVSDALLSVVRVVVSAHGIDVGYGGKGNSGP